VPLIKTWFSLSTLKSDLRPPTDTISSLSLCMTTSFTPDPRWTLSPRNLSDLSGPRSAISIATKIRARLYRPSVQVLGFGLAAVDTGTTSEGVRTFGRNGRAGLLKRVQWRFLMTSLVSQRATRNSGRSSNRPSSKLKKSRGTSRGDERGSPCWNATRRRLQGHRSIHYPLSWCGQGHRQPGLFSRTGARVSAQGRTANQTAQADTQVRQELGRVMMCHGFISAHILDDSDGLFHARAGRRSAEARSKDPRKNWVARQILGFMKPGPGRLTPNTKGPCS